MTNVEEMNVGFRVTLPLEGQTPNEETLQKLNEALEKI